MYQALYRKYRPKSFDEVCGQKHIVKTLQNAIKTNKVAHAYLFCGPRGTGKTSIAKIFAKAINCQNNNFDSCNECEICKSINENRSVDIIEMDAASNRGVEDIREIRDRVKFLPNQCKYKVYIIDEVHMLTTEAFNALLKTLEEPPSHVLFILATTEPHKIPLTILSRCQRFDFKGIEISDIEENIKNICKKENIEISKEAIYSIAYNADGGMRDALSLLDQVISFSDGLINEEDVHRVSGSVSSNNLINLAKYLIINEPTNALSILDELLNDGKEVPKILNDLLTFFRNILMYKNINSDKFYNVLYDNSEFTNLSTKITNQRIYYYIDVINEAIDNVKWTTQKRPYLELAIIKMTDKKETKDIEKLDKIVFLENKILELEKKILNINITPIKVENGLANEYSNIYEEVIWNNDTKQIERLNLAWAKLSNYPDLNLKGIASTLSFGKIEYYGNKKLIISFDDYLVDLMNQDDTKKQVFEILNRKSEIVKDYIAISKNEALRINSLNKGNKPKIPFESINQNKEMTLLEEAKIFFGEDKVVE